jgi:hypothetical protein
MLVACVALVAALAGNAVADGVDAVISAVKPNSITGKSVKNGSLTLADFSKKERAKLVGKTGKTGAQGPAGAQGAPGPQGPAGTPDGYTKSEADGAFLGKSAKAADADKLDGVDSSGFIQGSGALGSNYGLLATGGSNASFFDIPKIGKIQVSCDTAIGLVYDVAFSNDSGGTVRYSSQITDITSDGSAIDTTTGTSDQVANGATLTLTNNGSNLRDYVLRFQRTTGTIFTGFTTYTGTIQMMADAAPTGDSDRCKFQGEIQSATAHSGGLIILPF